MKINSTNQQTLRNSNKIYRNGELTKKILAKPMRATSKKLMVREKGFEPLNSYETRL